jgi:hypothetical protein
MLEQLQQWAERQPHALSRYVVTRLMPLCRAYSSFKPHEILHRVLTELAADRGLLEPLLRGDSLSEAAEFLPASFNLYHGDTHAL